MSNLLLVLFIVLLGVSGCLGSVHYMEPLEGAASSGSGLAPFNPDNYAVNSEDFPTYKIKAQFSLPDSEICTFGGCLKIRHTKVLPSDLWRVTHKIKSRYAIQSDSYNERQCRYLARNNSYGGWVNIFGKCLRPHDFAIYVSPDGAISGGWELLPGPMKVGKERYMYLNYSDEKNQGWPRGIIFQPSN